MLEPLFGAITKQDRPLNDPLPFMVLAAVAVLLTFAGFAMVAFTTIGLIVAFHYEDGKVVIASVFALLFAVTWLFLFWRYEVWLKKDKR